MSKKELHTLIKDEREYIFGSVDVFSKRHKIKLSVLSDLLSGKIREAGGFTLPFMKREVVLPDSIELEDMEGNIYTVDDLKAFSKEHKISLASLGGLASGVTLYSSGFVRKGNTYAKELFHSMNKGL